MNEMTTTTDAERSDTERLDWMIANIATVAVYQKGFRVHSPRFFLPECYATPRQAIDAAISLNQEPRT